MYWYLACCLDSCYHEDFDIPELIEVIGFDVALNNSSGDKYSNQIELLHYFNCSVALPMCRSPTDIDIFFCIYLFIYTLYFIRLKKSTVSSI